MNRKITIVGAHGVGKTASTSLENSTHNICDLHNVVDSQFTEPKEVFEITRLPEFKEPWIDPKEPIINYKKHYKTCAKKRKKRKKRKRR